MICARAFEYRLRPTQAQVARLVAWEGALRFLWNLCLEQYRSGLSRPRDERVFVSWVEQSREVTALRCEHDWIADVPRHACDAVGKRLAEAWRRCFRRAASSPNWKRRGRDVVSIHESQASAFWLRGSRLKFPRVGLLRVRAHLPLEGKPKTCTLKREGDQWFAVIVCEIGREPTKHTGPPVAIDRGITNAIADSNGVLVPGPRHYDKALGQLARAQRAVSRKKRGSANREKAKLRAMRIRRKVRRQRAHFLHVQSHRYAKSHSVVVIENLNVAGMVKNRRLARHIADAGWSTFANMLRYKLEERGGELVEVPAAYSSQTCNACSAVDVASRSGERFRCTSCGHDDHADTNAALNLLARWSPPGQPVEASA